MCEHHWELENITPPDGSRRRVVTLKCTLCKESMSKITTRTDREINAELEAQ